MKGKNSILMKQNLEIHEEFSNVLCCRNWRGEAITRTLPGGFGGPLRLLSLTFRRSLQPLENSPIKYSVTLNNQQDTVHLYCRMPCFLALLFSEPFRVVTFQYKQAKIHRKFQQNPRKMFGKYEIQGAKNKRIFKIEVNCGCMPHSAQKIISSFDSSSPCRTGCHYSSCCKNFVIGII